MNDITEVDRLNAEIADLKRTIEWYQGRTGIMMGAAAGAALAAVPASEPVAYLVDWHDIGEGAGKSCFYDADAKQHMESAVSYAMHARTRPSTVTPLYAAAPAPMVPSLMRVPAAAPAPVSGMPDLARLHALATRLDEQLAEILIPKCYPMLLIKEILAALPSPQAPDTPVAPEISDDEWSVMMHGPKSIIKREDWDPVTRRPKVAAPLPAAPAPTEQAGELPPLPDGILTPIPLVEPVYIAKALLAHRESHVVLDKGVGPLAAVHLVNIGLTGWTHNAETATAYAKGYNTALDQYRAALAARQAPTEPHPLDGLHINRGSMDAASDAYFLEWQKSKCRTAYENRYHKVAALCPYDEWEACWFKALAATTAPSAK